MFPASAKFWPGFGQSCPELGQDLAQVSQTGANLGPNLATAGRTVSNLANSGPNLAHFGEPPLTFGYNWPLSLELVRPTCGSHLEIAIQLGPVQNDMSEQLQASLNRSEDIQLPLGSLNMNVTVSMLWRRLSKARHVEQAWGVTPSRLDCEVAELKWPTSI